MLLRQLRRAKNQTDIFSYTAGRHKVNFWAFKNIFINLVTDFIDRISKKLQKIA